MSHLSEANFWMCVGVVLGWLLGVVTVVALLWLRDVIAAALYQPTGSEYPTGDAHFRVERDEIGRPIRVHAISIDHCTGAELPHATDADGVRPPKIRSVPA